MKLLFILTALAVVVAAVGHADDGHPTFKNSHPYQPDHNSPAPPPMDGSITPRDALDSIVHVQRDTNGDRIRRGEGIMKPTKRNSALRPRASPVPGCSAVTNTVGYIRVFRASDNSALGYVRKTYDQFNVYPYDVLQNALLVSLPSTVQNNQLFEITALNGPDASHPFVGAAAGASGNYFGTGNSGYAFLTGSSHTAANSPPANVGNSVDNNAASESTIWTIDCTSLAITAHWRNPDGTQPTTTIIQDASFNDILLTGDANAFTATYGDSVFPITFKFVPSA